MNHKTISMIRRCLVALIAANLIGVGFAVVPVSADPPAEFGVTERYVAVNPCTGFEHLVTLNFDIRQHQHGNKRILRANVTGSTSDGFVLKNGVYREKEVGDRFSSSVRNLWRHPDGSRFREQGRTVIDEATQGPIIDRRRAKCLGNRETFEEPIRTSTEGLAPLGQEYVDTVAGDIFVADGAVMFAAVDAQSEAVAGSNGVDSAGNAPTTTDVFRIGSITKVFTAVATLTLVDDGVVDLDAPASQYVTRIPVPADVTVRHLLSHRSGIVDHRSDPLLTPDRLWTPEEWLAGLESQPSLFEPGTQYSYSSANFQILGVLIEEVTGQPYHQALRERIISPLGLSSTYLAAFETGQEVFDPWDPEGNPNYDYTSLASSSWSAGGMVSSAGDLHTMFTALFNDQIVSSGLVAQMIDGDDYGLGLQFDGLGPELQAQEEGIFGHVGVVRGYLTVVRHSPETGDTVFLASTDSYSDPTYALEKMIEGFAALSLN